MLDEYNDELLKRDRPASLFEIRKQIMELESEKMVCTLMLNQIKLLEGNDEYKEQLDYFITELSNLGYDYNGNIEALEGKIDSLVNEIDDLLISEKSMSGIGKEISIERHINNIEKYRKVAIDTRKITVRQFLALEDDYIEYVNSLNKKDSHGTN